MRLNHWKNAVVMLILIVFGTACGPKCPEPRLIFLVSVASDGTLQNSFSDYASISPDGRYVGFASYASNLVSGDTNSERDVFLRDMQNKTTTRVSVASDGTQGNSYSYYASISAGGRYVAFGSNSDNLVNDDTNDQYDIFVRDMQIGITMRVSIASDGTQGNNWSDYPSISADGRYIAFISYADNLTDSDINGASDVFVRDLQTGVTTLVSLASDGTQGNNDSGNPSISADGRHIAFDSYANNLADNDNNSARDVFVRDMQTQTTTRISVVSDTMQGVTRSSNASISADGHYVAFLSGVIIQGSFGEEIWQPSVFVYDAQTGATTLVSVAWNGKRENDGSGLASISADGRYVAFVSSSDNLVNGDTNDAYDIFVRDMKTATTKLVSISSGRVQGNDLSRAPSISADGRYVSFHSAASNLVCGDTNRTDDIFLREIESPTSVP